MAGNKLTKRQLKRRSLRGYQDILTLLGEDVTPIDDSKLTERRLTDENDTRLERILVTLQGLLTAPSEEVITPTPDPVPPEPAEPQGTWTLLTNGDSINPELIFAGGDVISILIPE